LLDEAGAAATMVFNAGYEHIFTLAIVDGYFALVLTVAPFEGIGSVTMPSIGSGAAPELEFSQGAVNLAVESEEEGEEAYLLLPVALSRPRF